MNLDSQLILKQALRYVLSQRNGKKIVYVLRRRFWGNDSLNSIASDLNRGIERVRQYEAKGLRLLKRFFRINRIEMLDFVR